MVRRSEAEGGCWRGASGALLSDKIGIDAREGCGVDALLRGA